MSLYIHKKVHSESMLYLFSGWNKNDCFNNSQHDETFHLSVYGISHHSINLLYS